MLNRQAANPQEEEGVQMSLVGREPALSEGKPAHRLKTRLRPQGQQSDRTDDFPSKCGPFKSFTFEHTTHLQTSLTSDPFAMWLSTPDAEISIFGTEGVWLFISVNVKGGDFSGSIFITSFAAGES